jgi:hypothetical protein
MQLLMGQTPLQGAQSSIYAATGASGVLSWCAASREGIQDMLSIFCPNIELVVGQDGPVKMQRIKVRCRLTR